MTLTLDGIRRVQCDVCCGVVRQTEIVIDYSATIRGIAKCPQCMKTIYCKFHGDKYDPECSICLVGSEYYD